MAVEWIKNNMLFLDNERNRQLTEAELKVQQSLQKLSIPDWYLNKRSNPPKILKVIPTECRLPAWKNPATKRNCTSNSSSSDSIDKFPHVEKNVHEKAKKVAPPITSHKHKTFFQQMLPEIKHTRSSTKSSSPKEEILDVNIPMMKFPRKISKTFPKMSPSRKIQNINLVFPPGPKIKFPKDFEDMYSDDYNSDDSRKTFVLKERPFNVDRTTKIEDLRNIDVIIDERRENRQTNVSSQAFQAVTTPLNAPDAKPKFFKLRADSTAKSSQACEVATTPLSTPDVEPNFVKYCGKSIPKSSQASKVVTTPLNAPDVEPNFVKYCAKSIPKPFRASEVVTIPLNAPDVKPKFFKLRADSTLKSSQAPEVMTTPLSTPDVEPNFVKYCAKSIPKSSRASEVVTTSLNAPDVEPNFVKYCTKCISKSSRASEVVTIPLNAPDVKPKFFKLRADSTAKSSQACEVATTPLSTPDVEPNFVKYCAKSIPKSSRASEVVAIPLNAPDVEPNFVKCCAKSIPKPFRASEVATIPLNAPDVKPKFFKLRANSTPKSSQAHIFSSAIIENSPKERILSPSILEKSLIFENKSMNVSNRSENIRRPKKICPNLLEKTFIFEKSSSHNSSKESNNPIDLQLPLRSKQFARNRKENIVREVVRNLDEKMKKSLQPRHSQNNKERFVKQIVNALEKGDISRMRSLSSRSSINDEDSPSESETKSYVTSNKDTDYSDYGRRSPILNSDDDQTANSEYFKKDTLEVKKTSAEEDDSVYWISIPRCTLPRSSSLLSVASKLSSNGHSPCISPIKSPNEVEYSLQTSWGATYKTSNPLSKKLFHETVVIDSGYSD